MKHVYLAILFALVATLIVTPVFAQTPRGGDRVCTGGSIVIDSDAVVDSLILFRCGARISNGAHVRKDIVSFGGQVVVEQGANIDKSIVVIGSRGPVEIAGSVGQDVVTIAADVTLDATAVVGKDLVVVGGRTVQKEGAIVRGRSVRPEPSVRIPSVPPASNGIVTSSISRMIGSIVSGIAFIIGLVAVGMIIVAVWPQQTRQVSRVARDSALPSLGVGCLTIIVAFTLGIGLIVTLCGIPIAAIMFLALALAWLVGWIALGEFTGSKVLEPLHMRDSLKTPVVAVVVGIVLLALIGFAPFIGWFVSIIAATIGIGAVVLTRFGTRSYPASPSALPPAATSTPSPQAPP